MEHIRYVHSVSEIDTLLYKKPSSTQHTVNVRSKQHRAAADSTTRLARLYTSKNGSILLMGVGITNRIQKHETENRVHRRGDARTI